MISENSGIVHRSGIYMQMTQQASITNLFTCNNFWFAMYVTLSYIMFLVKPLDDLYILLHAQLEFFVRYRKVGVLLFAAWPCQCSYALMSDSQNQLSDRNTRL